MSDKSNASVRDSATAIKRSAEVAANEIHRFSNAVARQDSKFADGTQTLTQAVGGGLDKCGKLAASIGREASRSMHNNASPAADAVREAIAGKNHSAPSALRKAAGGLGWLTTKVAAHVGGIAADAVMVVGITAMVTGRYTAKSASAFGGVVGGMVRGTAMVTSNAVDGVALPASKIEDMRTQLRTMGQAERNQAELRMLDINSAKRSGRKNELLDLLVVGSVTLANALRDPSGVSPEVEQAFHLAYPGLSQAESFSEAVNRMSSDELVGLVSLIKGKLFETELVSHLNSGSLPEGFQASLAESVTQPGWDIQITDTNGQISELLQAKATESVQYVNEALKRHPDIDVTTTSEVHAQLLARGLAENVHNSGISETVLQARAEAASQAGSALDVSDLVPSSIGLAVIALSVFMDKGATLREKGAAFGTRSAKAGASSVAGKLVLVATQTWWLGLIAGVGSGWLANRGHSKREQYEALRQALRLMKARNMRCLASCPPIFGRYDGVFLSCSHTGRIA